MGYSADAELIWGVPLDAYNEEGEPNPWFDEEENDISLEALIGRKEGLKLSYADDEYDPEAWQMARDLAAASRLAFKHYGHCDDSEGPRCILTIKEVKSYSGGCWEPGVVESLKDWPLSIRDKAISKANEECADLGLPSFDGAEWYLVASYG